MRRADATVFAGRLNQATASVGILHIARVVETDKLLRVIQTHRLAVSVGRARVRVRRSRAPGDIAFRQTGIGAAADGRADAASLAINVAVGASRTVAGWFAAPDNYGTTQSRQTVQKGTAVMIDITAVGLKKAAIGALALTLAQAGLNIVLLRDARTGQIIDGAHFISLTLSGVGAGLAQIARRIANTGDGGVKAGIAIKTEIGAAIDNGAIAGQTAFIPMLYKRARLQTTGQAKDKPNYQITERAKCWA